MSKPLNDNIRYVSIEDDAGDLRPLLDEAGDKLSELVRAVSATGKAGSLTIKLDLKPSTAGALAVKPTVKVTLPKGLPAESLLWPTPEGNLITEDPRQSKLPLKAVADDTTELRTVSQQ